MRQYINPFQVFQTTYTITTAEETAGVANKTVDISDMIELAFAEAYDGTSPFQKATLDIRGVGQEPLVLELGISTWSHAASRIMPLGVPMRVTQLNFKINRPIDGDVWTFRYAIRSVR